MLARHLTAFCLLLGCGTEPAKAMDCAPGPAVMAEAWQTFEVHLFEVQHLRTADWFAWLARLPAAEPQLIPVTGGPGMPADMAFGARLDATAVSPEELRAALPGEVLAHHGPLTLSASMGNPSQYRYATQMPYVVRSDTEGRANQWGHIKLPVQLQLTPYPGGAAPVALALRWESVRSWQQNTEQGREEPRMVSHLGESCVGLSPGKAFVLAGARRAQSVEGQLTPWQIDIVVWVQARPSP